LESWWRLGGDYISEHMTVFPSVVEFSDENIWTDSAGALPCGPVLSATVDFRQFTEMYNFFGVTFR